MPFLLGFRSRHMIQIKMGERTLLPAQLPKVRPRHFQDVRPADQAGIAAQRDELLKLFERAVGGELGRQFLARADIDELIELILPSTRSAALLPHHRAPAGVRGLCV